jgi:hypothetical protein
VIARYELRDTHPIASNKTFTDLARRVDGAQGRN